MSLFQPTITSLGSNTRTSPKNTPLRFDSIDKKHLWAVAAHLAKCLVAIYRQSIGGKDSVLTTDIPYQKSFCQLSYILLLPYQWEAHFWYLYELRTQYQNWLKIMYK